MKHGGDRVFVLRHDVDSPFVYRKGLFKKIANRIYLSDPDLPGKQFLPGYHEALKAILEIEKKFDTRASFFFRTATCPPPDIVRRLLDDRHEIAYHADRIESFEEFHEDLVSLTQKTGCMIDGFTKHGYAKVRSGGHWNEAKMVEYAKRANLKYLAQGEDHEDIDVPQLISGVYVLGHHMTVKDRSLEDMTKYIESHEWPMIMIHPEDLFIEGVKDKFVKILETAKAIPVGAALKLIAK